jgi:hypothetical protein
VRSFPPKLTSHFEIDETMWMARIAGFDTISLTGTRLWSGMASRQLRKMRTHFSSSQSWREPPSENKRRTATDSKKSPAKTSP